MRLGLGILRRRSSVAHMPLPDGLSKLFEGATESELADFLGGLIQGNELALLFQELVKGETIVGLDKDGAALRIVSVAKPMILDARNGELLVEVVQTALGTTDERLRVKATGMSEKFNPLCETSREACGRALREELQWGKATADMFSSRTRMVVETAVSDKFQGLRTQYHLYIHLLKPSIVARLQCELGPRGKLSRVDEECELDPRSLWWAWIAPRSEEAVTSYLLQVAAEAGFASLPLSAVDKFGTTPAGTVMAQMDKALEYLDELVGWD